jgi:hypothetical protein
MKNFTLYPPVDTKPFLDELEKNISLKNINFETKPRLHPVSERIHKDSSWHFLRSNFPGYIDGNEIFSIDNSLFVRTTSLTTSFPKLYRFLLDFARQQNAMLRRISIVALEAEGNVSPHIDTGTYYARTNRHHLVLISPHGSEFSSGDEKAVLRERELWWFDNKKMHSVKNLSNDLRVHVIFDLLPKKNISLWHRTRLHFFEFLFESIFDEKTPSIFIEFIKRHPFLGKILTA